MFDYIAADKIGTLKKNYDEMYEMIEKLDKAFDELSKRLEILEKQKTDLKLEND